MFTAFWGVGRRRVAWSFLTAGWTRGTRTLSPKAWCALSGPICAMPAADGGRRVRPGLAGPVHHLLFFLGRHGVFCDTSSVLTAPAGAQTPQAMGSASQDHPHFVHVWVSWTLTRQPSIRGPHNPLLRFNHLLGQLRTFARTYKILY